MHVLLTETFVVPATGKPAAQCYITAELLAEIEKTWGGNPNFRGIKNPMQDESGLWYYTARIWDDNARLVEYHMVVSLEALPE